MRSSAFFALPLLLSSCVLVYVDESAERDSMSAHSKQTAAAARSATQAADVLPYRATETTLANGLKVIVVPTGMPNLVSLQIPVQTGSRNEVEPGKTGFAHFFEHMMFRGTEAFPPEKYESIVTQAGARQNAYTTDDYTNYHITFAKEDLEQILQIEADRFQRLKYSEEQFRTEARAVLGEYNKNSANPAVKLDEVMVDTAFTTHTYKHTTMGFLADIEDMPNQLEYAKVFFDRWYRPEYATLMLVGDVDAATALPLVEKYFGTWARGSYQVAVPQEPAPAGPKYAHVPWSSPTAPLVAVGFHGPAFSEHDKDSVALDLLMELYFGSTSELYKKLVLDEQKVDDLSYGAAASQDPSLATIWAQLRSPADALYVRDQILATCAQARVRDVDPARLAEAQANNRYGTSRRLDNTEAIASTLARYVRFRRAFDTFNQLFRLYDAVTPADCLAAGAKYFSDERLVVTTLSHEALAPEVAQNLALPKLVAAASKPTDAPLVELANPSRQLTFKLQFLVGSAHDPVGKEGLASIAAALISDGGSARMKVEDIQRVLFPIAGSFGAFVDREMTTFNGSIHADNLDVYFDTVLPQLVEPGWREEDFQRVKQQVKNSLVQDLRANNDEELGKEALQAALFAGSGYGHPSQGTVAGIDAVTLEDVQQFVARNYTQAKLVVGLAGDLAPEGKARLLGELGRLPQGERGAASVPSAHRPEGLEVDIVQKDTRATAISFGHPLDVVRGHPDFAALYLARTWLGEHRSSMSHLYQRIRELRGMNYGDYAYIEAFRFGGSSFFPAPNQARRAQLFEVWIRPVKPEHAHHALRIALHELDRLVENGLTQEDFERVRTYLSKNVFLATASQSAALGAALDSRFYGVAESTQFMRDALAKLTVADVNAALKRHISADKLRIVCVTKDAEGLKAKLVSDEPSSMTYESEKPQALLDEDRSIGARKLSIAPDKVRILPIDQVFQR
ncbi:MAG: insulinase family protein [Planctomycetes bacterium]|nr:insulinase family protein [Planctomycetota bacterium]